MRNTWLFFMDLDGGGSPYIFPLEPFVSNGFGAHLFSQFSSFLDSSLYHSKHLYVPGSLAFREAFSCMSKFTGAILFWFSSMSTSKLSRDISSGNQCGLESRSCESSALVKHLFSCKNNLAGCRFASDSRGLFGTPLVFGKISSFAMRSFFGEAEALRHIPLLSLAAALIPPLDNLSSKVLAVPLDNTELQMQELMDRRPCEVGQGCGSLSFLDLNRRRLAIEPRTGIEFPTILDNMLDTQNNSSLASEVLVGTGSRTMKIIKIKSLKVYAFGFYIHPYSVCKKLGAKYASIPVDELNKHNDFYQDLLSEDIGMTVRLVVNCNGMKVNTVRDAFEKSLRARLVKTNPNTDYRCLSTFGSYFTQDIPLPAGTIIDFQRTADGQLITKIGGNQIGAVHSKDLCRAFFDMYIGDFPVSEQTKEDIGRNVANIIRRC
ncbi:fatty-acid-binding protein 2-like isoform X1 [Gossypium arboreum]|uniref:fatty-acid-binding protein 2-like isoform X1 n=1 Tax=Gossypium arboreum TaxID=29729 RepID=UPI00081974DD|nr:fatty-acid-binding protein 2-like isoform X1 [Gossypium arboreum]XP_017639027.1 fatty-acid-binding protein 2-like isoform X1 [Gossypium arboreum]